MCCLSFWVTLSTSDPMFKWPSLQETLSSRNSLFKWTTDPLFKKPYPALLLEIITSSDLLFMGRSLQIDHLLVTFSSCDPLVKLHSLIVWYLIFFWSRTDLKQSIRSGLRPYATFKQHHLCLTTLQVALSSSNALFKQCFHQVSKFQKCGHPASYVCWKKQQPSSSFSQFASLCTPLVLVHK